MGKGPTCNTGGTGSIPGSGRTPGGGNGSPLQPSCLENLMDGGVWWATLHGVAESDTTEASRHECTVPPKDLSCSLTIYHLACLPSLPVMIPGDFHSPIKVSGLSAHRLVYCPSPVLLLNHLLPFIFTYNATLTLSLLTLHSPACACLMPYLA